MKLSFTTLACPDWDVRTIVKKAYEYGFDGLDFRGTGSGLDITTQAEFTSGIEETRGMIDEHGLVVSGVSSSLRICDVGLFETNIEEARRTIPVARALGAEQVRVFGYGDPTLDRDQSIDYGRRCMEAILEIDGADQINWLLEMHDHWMEAEVCKKLIDSVGSPNFQILWDIGHTTRVGGETAEHTLSVLGNIIPCVHLKDAVFDKSHPHAMKDGWHYVLPGRGELPLAGAVRALMDRNFDGWYVFEHEKRWHADLEEPDEALAAYVKWMRSFPAVV